MPLLISDEFLQHAGLDERAARIEIACRLYDADKIGKGYAARFAEMSRDAFDDELRDRGLPVLKYTEDMLKQDLETLEYLRQLKESHHADRGE